MLCSPRLSNAIEHKTRSRPACTRWRRSSRRRCHRGGVPAAARAWVDVFAPRSSRRRRRGANRGRWRRARSRSASGPLSGLWKDFGVTVTGAPVLPGQRGTGAVVAWGSLGTGGCKGLARTSCFAPGKDSTPRSDLCFPGWERRSGERSCPSSHASSAGSRDDLCQRESCRVR